MSETRLEKQKREAALPILMALKNGPLDRDRLIAVTRLSNNALDRRMNYLHKKNKVRICGRIAIRGKSSGPGKFIYELCEGALDLASAPKLTPPPYRTGYAFW